MEINKTETAVNHEPSHIEDLDEKIYEKQQHRHHREDDASSIMSEALGDDLPPGYFYSVRFIGVMFVCKIIIEPPIQTPAKIMVAGLLFVGRVSIHLPTDAH